MDKMNKNKRIDLRLTEKEYLFLKEKAKNYPTLSSFVLDACRNFDDELGIKRLDVIRKWCSDYKKYEYELNRIGCNINQIAHYLNKLADVGILSDKFLPELKRQYSVLIELLTQLNSSNMNFRKNASGFLKGKKR